MELMKAEQLKAISKEGMSADMKKLIEEIYTDLIHVAYRGFRRYDKVYDVNTKVYDVDYHRACTDTIAAYFDDFGYKAYIDPRIIDDSSNKLYQVQYDVLIIW